MRQGSREAQKEKSMEIMDVNTDEIATLFKSHQVQLLIHGHTHRPGIHATAEGMRYVLPDWDCESDAKRGGWISLNSEGDFYQVNL